MKEFELSVQSRRKAKDMGFICIEDEQMELDRMTTILQNISQDIFEMVEKSFKDGLLTGWSMQGCLGGYSEDDCLHDEWQMSDTFSESRKKIADLNKYLR
jgi:hypothetical protein